MTVTIAKYLTPANHDIHHRGILPDVPAKLTEEEAKALTIEDLGTRKDPQYRVAEGTLVKAMQTSATLQKVFNPASANVPAAVGGP
jgi:carboxyl-terminal processing protease